MSSGALEQAFFEEARILFGRMEEGIAELSRGYREESLETLFRSFHTMKSSSRALGYELFATFMHNLESQCEEAREGKSIPSFLMKLRILLTDLRAMIEKEVPLNDTLIKPLLESWNAPHRIEKESLAIPEHLFLSKKQYDQLASTTEAILSERIRVETLGESMGEIVERTHNREGIMIGKEYTEATALLRRATTDLEELLRSARMVPLSVFFDRLPAVHEALNHELGKHTQLQISGGHIHVDRAVAGELGGALLHLVRNAIDHGILGEGIIRVEAQQKKNQIHLVIEDSGQGIQYDTIVRLAKERGILSREQELSQEEKQELLFHPHLSTKEVVTEVSGRGIGMNAVRAYTRSVGGSIVVESPTSAQGGTRIILQIPISLSLVRILVIRAGNGTFGIPIATIKMSLPFQKENLREDAGKQYIEVQGKWIPLYSLESSLDLGESYSTKKTPMVLVEDTGKGEKGYLVDTIVHEEDVLMKTLPKLLSTLPAFAGAATIGDGRTILILNLGGIPEAKFTLEQQSGTKIPLNSEQRDILMEVMNIVASHAGTAIARRIGKPVSLSVPEYGDSDGGLSQDDWGATAVGVRMSLEGSYPGRLLFEIPASLAGSITEHILGKAADLHLLSGDERVFLQEIGSIAMHAMGNKLSQISKHPVMTNISDMRVDARGALRSHFLSAHVDPQDRISVRLWFGIGEGIRTDDHRETGSITMEFPIEEAKKLVSASGELFLS